MAYKIRPKILIDCGRQNAPIKIPIADLLLNTDSSFLTNDFDINVGAITVQNIIGFAIDQIIFIGSPGNENAEIIKTHGSTAPTGNIVTLASTTNQPHTNSDSVYVIPFDQVEISKAATITGTKTVLNTLTLDVDTETRYNDTTTTTGYYFARFKNSITDDFSNYSDGVPLSGYPINSARAIIDSAKDEINKEQSEIFTDEYGFKKINEAQMEVLRELKRWSWMQVFGATSEAFVGSWRIALPDDIDDSNTNKSIYNFSIGNDQNMIWVDKEEFDKITYDVRYSQLVNQLSVGDAIVTLADSSDFNDSGTIQIGNNVLSYTTNNKTNGILTLTSVSTISITSNYDVFQNVSLGSPLYYTIHSGYVWHYPACDIMHDKLDYSMDYYSQLVPINSDTDTIIVPDSVMIKDYLVAKFIKRMNNGEDTSGSLEAMKSFDARLIKMKQTETMNRKIILKPRMNNYFNLSDGDSKQTRLQGFITN
jgi:hypothetical protein